MGTRLLLAGVAVMAIGCASHQTSECCTPATTPAGAPQTVTVVQSLEPIRSEFNAHADQPRAVLLVSPACSECVFGAEVVRQSIMDRFAASGVHAIVVWEPMLKPDNEAAARKSSGIFAGTHATQFYDPERKSGWAYERDQFSRKWDEVAAALPADHWLRVTHDRKPDPGPEWDVYMLYKPGVRWEAQAPKPDAFIRHIGRDDQGRSRYWRDRFNAPPTVGDLHEAMERMGHDILSTPQATRIELLGFPTCPNTPAMRRNLQTALKSLGDGTTFDDVDLDQLPAGDPRRGWPAPTILVNGEDLFGMPVPASPSMGCRVYPDGTPTADAIAAKLGVRVTQRHG